MPSQGSPMTSSYHFRLLLIFCSLTSAISSMAASPDATPQSSITAALQLHQGWKLQSSRQVSDGGERIASVGYKPSGWRDIVVPSTVVAGQLAAGDFKNKDIYFGMNLRQLPGMTYPIGMNNFNRT